MSLSTLYLRLRYRRHTFGPGFEGPWRLRIRGQGRVIFGRDVRVRNASGHTALLTFGADARIEIGDRVEIDGAGRSFSPSVCRSYPLYPCSYDE